jgi:hypothetical protein
MMTRLELHEGGSSTVSMMTLLLATGDTTEVSALAMVRDIEEIAYEFESEAAAIS